MSTDLQWHVRETLRQVLQEMGGVSYAKPGSELVSERIGDSPLNKVRVVDYGRHVSPYEAVSSDLQTAILDKRDILPQSAVIQGRSASGPAHVQKLKDPELMTALQKSTPARIGVGRTGARPRTETLLHFRADHAAAVDAVFGQLDFSVPAEVGMFTVNTLVADKQTYILRPDLGRRLSPEGAEMLGTRCEKRPQVQIVASDGLSSQAIASNLRDCYLALCQSLEMNGLQAGTPFYVNMGRVAVMDHIGEILEPDALVLLIGERPGLVASDSMSAYLCYRPRFGTVEADRMVLSNIHHGGIPPVEAGAYLGDLLKRILEKKASGVKLSAME